jgi:phytoene dehydrogenase-like protein
MHADGTTDFDVVIIGAGVGGLVCGCYLARAGMNVLIAERHSMPGGYCSSFRRKGYVFDAAAHCFGGYRPGGVTREIFEDLALDKVLKIVQADPSTIVTTPDFTMRFAIDPRRTLDNVQKYFPEERSNVASFFRFLVDPDANAFSRLRTTTLETLLSRYIKDSRLRFLLTAPLLGLGGLPPSRMSAFVGAKLFSEFLLDGGYHPAGGMRALSEALAGQFTALGGTLKLSCLVKKIHIRNGRVSGVSLDPGDHVSSNIVVSNGDARQTFFELLGEDRLDGAFSAVLKNMEPSISNFILYLGLDKHYQELPASGPTWCYFPHYDLDRAYEAALQGDTEGYGGHMFYISGDPPALLAIVPAAYTSEASWKDAKERWTDSFINRLEKGSIPHLSRHIVVREAATPSTLHRYTLNFRGSSFGWAGTPGQLAVPGFKKHSSIPGLYLTGHWTTQGLGISGVMYVGRDTAKMISKRWRNSL